MRTYIIVGDKMSNVLVAYFSASGVTKNVAEKIADENGYDLFEIKPVEPYTAADLDYTNKDSRSTIEMNDKEFRPPIVESCDASQYDTVVIEAFCTSGGTGIDGCVNNLQNAYPELKFAKGMRFMGNVSAAKEWIENE